MYDRNAGMISNWTKSKFGRFDKTFDTVARMLEHTDKQGAMKVLSAGSKSGYSQGNSRS